MATIGCPVKFLIDFQVERRAASRDGTDRADRILMEPGLLIDAFLSLTYRSMAVPI